MNTNWKMQISELLISEGNGELKPTVIKGRILQDPLDFPSKFDAVPCEMYAGDSQVLKLEVSSCFTTMDLEEAEVALYTESLVSEKLRDLISEGLFLRALGGVARGLER